MLGQRNGCGAEMLAVSPIFTIFLARLPVKNSQYLRLPVNLPVNTGNSRSQFGNSIRVGKKIPALKTKKMANR